MKQCWKNERVPSEDHGGPFNLGQCSPQNPARLMLSILLVMPAGTIITSDVWSPEPPIPLADKKVKLKMINLPLTFQASSSMGPTTQLFFQPFGMSE